MSESERQLQEMLQQGESLVVEFKSDLKCLPDRELAPALQKSESQTRILLERLLESGLIEAHGSGRGRSYTLSAKVYQQAGQQAAYVRQVGFDKIQQEQMVLKYVAAHGSIKRKEVMTLCRINKDQAYRLLKGLASVGSLQLLGQGKGGKYVLPR